MRAVKTSQLGYILVFHGTILVVKVPVPSRLRTDVKASLVVVGLMGPWRVGRHARFNSDRLVTCAGSSFAPPNVSGQ